MDRKHEMMYRFPCCPLLFLVRYCTKYKCVCVFYFCKRVACVSCCVHSAALSNPSEYSLSGHKILVCVYRRDVFFPRPLITLVVLQTRDTLLFLLTLLSILYSSHLVVIASFLRRFHRRRHHERQRTPTGRPPQSAAQNVDRGGQFFRIRRYQRSRGVGGCRGRVRGTRVRNARTGSWIGLPLHWSGVSGVRDAFFSRLGV